MSLSDRFGEYFHPAFLFSTTIRVEVNDLSIGKADPESLFDEHVALLFFGKRGLAATASLSRRLLLS